MNPLDLLKATGIVFLLVFIWIASSIIISIIGTIIVIWVVALILSENKEDTT